MSKKFQIWYDDCSCFSSDDGEIWEAPRYGVQIIKYEDADYGFINWLGRDYYWWWPEGFLAGDIFGLFDFLGSVKGPTFVVFFGRVIQNSQWLDVRRAALRDERMGPQSNPTPRAGRD